jgi:hypothetical protein
MRTLIAVAAAVLATGCTVINTTALPSDRSGKDVFVTAGDIPDPHDVVGIVQATRSGVLLFGFIDVVGTDLDAGFKEVLIPQIKEMGGDGAVRARFHMTQYTPGAKVLGAIFFIFPLPSEVTITAQVVKLRRGAAPAQPTPAVVAPPASGNL